MTETGEHNRYDLISTAFTVEAALSFYDQKKKTKDQHEEDCKKMVKYAFDKVGEDFLEKEFVELLCEAYREDIK